MMDESLDQLFYTSLWSDLDVNQRSLWVYGESGEADRPVISSVGWGEDNNNDSPTSMTNSIHKLDSSATQEEASSIVLGFESDNYIDRGLILEESQGQNCYRSPSYAMLNSGMVNNLAIPTSFCENGDKLRSSLSYIEVGHSNSNYGVETSSFERFEKDLQTFSPIQQPCPFPYFECVTSVSPHFEKQQRNRGLMQEENVENDLRVSESKHFNFSASVPSMGKQDLRNYALSSFASAQQPTMGMTELQPLPQINSNTCSEESNGCGKPRVRARRGQATDPHSIAERLRREKIAERMKTLQELVPSSDKNMMDKASVLDEIIEYVKFLQLQVKAPKALSPSSSTVQVASVLASDEIAIEQVVKLMETDMTLAMQYLQDKGICLMPVALAAEISREKESLSSLVCEDWKSNIGFTKERSFSQ